MNKPNKLFYTQILTERFDRHWLYNFYYHFDDILTGDIKWANDEDIMLDELQNYRLTWYPE